MVLTVIALWSTCRVVGAGSTVPDDEAWRRAAALVDEQHQPGELIVFAPAWIEPVGRLHLGARIPVELAAGLDAGRHGVIYELSIRGARAAETRGLRPVWQREVGGVMVRRFERAPATLVTDLVAVAARAAFTTEGLSARPPAVVLAEVGFRPHRCLQMVPSAGQTVTLTFPGVELGTELVGGVGLADIFKRRQVRAPAELVVAVGEQEVARVTVGVDDGWVRFRAATTPGTASVTVTAQGIGPGAADRQVCMALEARR